MKQQASSSLMTDRSPHIAFYLTMIYLFSFIMSSLPLSVMGEAYVKTECPNKNKKVAADILSSNSAQFPLNQHSEKKPQEKKAPEEFSRCAIATIFIVPSHTAIIQQFPVQIKKVGFPTKLYQSPNLEKFGNPPQSI